MSRKPTPRKTARAPEPATELNRHALYELCAQAPQRDVRVLSAIHGGRPKILGEDFCGTAALSRAWVALSARHAAVAVDHDAETLAKAPPSPRVKLIRSDVRRASSPADLIAVLNFSICELHRRADLLNYLRKARHRLTRRGCLICDIYGGGDAFLTGSITQRFTGPRGERIRYDWEQRTADPLTGRVVNAMHFQVSGARGRATSLNNAFIYDWRLWSVPELREAMSEAGFGSTEVHDRQPGAIDDHGEFHSHPIEDAAEVGASFSVYVVGRA